MLNPRQILFDLNKYETEIRRHNFFELPLISLIRFSGSATFAVRQSQLI